MSNLISDAALENLKQEILSTFVRERLFREDYSQLLMAELRRYIDKQINDVFARRLALVITPGSRVFTHTNDGHRIYLDPSEPFITLHVLEHGEWEAPVRRVMRELLIEGASFLDVGANIGLHSLLASQMVGISGKLLLLEPHPTTAQFLKDNLEINGLESRAIVVEAAAAEVDGTVRRFEYFMQHSAMSGFALSPERVANFRGTSQALDVPVVTLDALLARHSITPDLVKIDVEGFELQVLTGASKLLSSSSDTAFIVEHNITLAESVLGATAATDVLNCFKTNGFCAYLIQSDGCKFLNETELMRAEGDILFIRPNSPRIAKLTLGAGQ